MLVYDQKNRMTAKQALSDEWILSNTEKGSIRSEDIQLSLDQLKLFGARSSLHKAVLIFMAGRLISKKKEKKLRAIFQAIDTNNDGQLTKQELMEAFSKFYDGNSQAAEQEVDRIMRRVDCNKNGIIDYKGKIKAKIKRNRVFNGKYKEKKAIK